MQNEFHAVLVSRKKKTPSSYNENNVPIDNLVLVVAVRQLVDPIYYYIIKGDCNNTSLQKYLASQKIKSSMLRAPF